MHMDVDKKQSGTFIFAAQTKQQTVESVNSKCNLNSIKRNLLFKSSHDVDFSATFE